MEHPLHGLLSPPNNSWKEVVGGEPFDEEIAEGLDKEPRQEEGLNRGRLSPVDAFKPAMYHEVRGSSRVRLFSLGRADRFVKLAQPPSLLLT